MLSKTAYFQRVATEIFTVFQAKSTKIFKQPIDFLKD